MNELFWEFVFMFALHLMAILKSTQEEMCNCKYHVMCSLTITVRNHGGTAFYVYFQSVNQYCHIFGFFFSFFAAIRYFPIVEENKSQLQWEWIDYGKRKIHLSNAILSAFDPEAIISHSNQSHGFLFPEKISLHRLSEHYLPIKNAFLYSFIVKHSLLSHHFRCGINFAVVTNHLHT